MLIVCTLRWYVKCIYRHLFLEDTSKKASDTQKIAPPNYGKDNSQVPATYAQIWFVAYQNT